MQSIDDIFSSDIGYGLGQDVEVQGWLVISENLCYLTNSSDDQKSAILVIAPGICEQFLTQLPVRAGTMVSFAGNARVSGKALQSGLVPLPYAIYRVKKIEFQEKSGGNAIYAPPAENGPHWEDL